MDVKMMVMMMMIQNDIVSGGLLNVVAITQSTTVTAMTDLNINDEKSVETRQKSQFQIE